MENNSENSNFTPSEVFRLIISRFTPSEVFRLIISRFPTTDIAVVGKIIKEKGYVKLSDDNDNNAKITLYGINNNDYQEGSKVEAIGYLTYQINNGAIYPNLNPNRGVKVIEQNMEGDESNRIKENELNRIKEMARKRRSGRDFIGYLLSIAKQESVNILLIYGQGAQVHIDFKNGFYPSIGSYKDKVKLEFTETKLNDDDLSKTLQQIDTSKYHLVFIIRGGGSEEDLSRVGGEKSAKVIIEKDMPLYLALGHSLDKGLSVLEDVADYVFPTPSIAGQETGGLLRLYFEEEEIKKQNIDFQAQITKEQETVKKLQASINKKEEHIQSLYKKLSENSQQLSEKEELSKSLMLKDEQLKAISDVNRKLEADIKALKGRSNILYAIIFTLFVLLVFLTVKHHF